MSGCGVGPWKQPQLCCHPGAFHSPSPDVPGGQGSAAIPPPSGRQRRAVRKDSHVPKDLSSPTAEPGPRSRAQSLVLPLCGRFGRQGSEPGTPSLWPLRAAGLRAWYSLSVAASGGRGLGGPRDFRTPREGLDPLAIQLPPTPHCRELSGAAHALQNPLPPSPAD